VRGLFGLGLFAWAVTASADCLLYERDVTLTGVVNYRTSGKTRDAILRLDSPVCVRSARQQDDLGANVPRDNIRLIQLVMLPSISPPSQDSEIAVTGMLFGADSARHRTRVLLYVKAMEALSPQKRPTP